MVKIFLGTNQPQIMQASRQCHSEEWSDEAIPSLRDCFANRPQWHAGNHF